MYLSRHQTPSGPRWALDDNFLPPGVTLGALLALPATAWNATLASLPRGPLVSGPTVSPVERGMEVWACGVTYLRSRQAREAESATADVYQKVYQAPRPEIFFKSPGWRVVGPRQPVRIRRDTHWNVPEPELTLVINAMGEIVGYTIGNDMSSRDIEGENPLYLPQAKTYNGSCAIGPGIHLMSPDAMSDLPIALEILRNGVVAFSGETSTRQMKRTFQELAAYLYRELDFPHGAFLMTGTGIVPPDSFTLHIGDAIRVTIAHDTLENLVA
jgi:2-dehydro-3-deoxy-D-arabinonate dehydratase